MLQHGLTFPPFSPAKLCVSNRFCVRVCGSCTGVCSPCWCSRRDKKQLLCFCFRLLGGLKLLFSAVLYLPAMSPNWRVHAEYFTLPFATLSAFTWAERSQRKVSIDALVTGLCSGLLLPPRLWELPAQLNSHLSCVPAVFQLCHKVFNFSLIGLK